MEELLYTICTVLEDNIDILKQVLDQHQLQYTSEHFTNDRGECGYRIRIELNKVLYFREIIAPEYKQTKISLYQGIHEVFGDNHVRNY